jgi:CBS domain-containing protein
VAHAMQRNVASVTELTPLKEVARQLAGKNIRRLLVLRDGKLAGIVSRADLVKAIAGGAA